MNLIDIFLHLDKYLAIIISNYGMATYAVLFLVVFMETGFVVTPFLPGDSLLFAAGALAPLTTIDIWPVYILFLVAAILGDTINYWIGHFFGLRMTFVKREHLEKTQKFYDKHGDITIILARFVPIVRTFAPFVAGIAKMDYRHFINYNVIGGFLWVTLFTWGGYFFGNLPFVKANFHYVVLVIIFLSVTPILFEVFKQVTSSHGRRNRNFKNRENSRSNISQDSRRKGGNSAD